MATGIAGKDIRRVTLGVKVDRATASLPQTTTATLFTVTTGRIIVTNIVGEVTTAIQAQANAIKLVSTPTTGTSGDISGTLDINGYEVGALVSLNPIALSTALSGADAHAALVPHGAGLIIPIGAIRLNTAASNTGAMKWSLTYIPFDDGAAVAAA